MGQKAVVIALVAIWLGLSGWALWLALTMPPTGDGFTRGADRAMAVLSRELYATIAAVGAWILGRRLPGGWIRRLSLVPIGVTALLGLAAMAAMLWAVLTN